MDFFAEGLHPLRRQGAGLVAGVFADAGGQRAVQVAGKGGNLLHIPEQAQMIFPGPVMGAVCHEPFLVQARLLNGKPLPLQRLARQRPVHLGDELADAGGVKEDKVGFQREIAALRGPVDRGMDQQAVQHRHHRHELPHEVQPALLRAVHHGNLHPGVGHRHHPGHAVSIGPDDVFHSGMGLQHFPDGADQRLRGHPLGGPGQIGKGIGGLAAAGEAFQINAHLGLRKRIDVPVHGRDDRLLAAVQEGCQSPGRGMG